eukprot:TRINITY_DN4496_c1_g2_i2.p1 TRINITY_DN4496_c1_g2~~TRINITY_DN4496_c1_g2_i2.p1  ORF type:complete len:1042 (-),score=276.32 TRINITY_DN4496_c1_g2_i2:999-3974(-)
MTVCLPPPIVLVPVPPPIVELHKDTPLPALLPNRATPAVQYIATPYLTAAQIRFVKDKSFLAQTVALLASCNQSQADRLSCLNTLIELSHIIHDVTAHVPAKTFIEGVSEHLVSRIRPIRVAAIRVFAAFATSAALVAEMTALDVPLFICRSLEKGPSTRDPQGEEHLEAMRFLQHVITRYPALVHRGIVQSLIALVEAPEDDICHLQCLELLCDLAVQNTQVVATCNGLSTILKCVIDPNFECMMPVLTALVVYLLNDECTRKYIRLETHINLILWPLSYYFSGKSHSEGEYTQGGGTTTKDKQRQGKSLAVAVLSESEKRLRKNQYRLACEFVRLSLCSWSGLICLSSGSFGVRTLVHVLLVPVEQQLKEMIMNTVFDLFRIPQPSPDAPYSNNNRMAAVLTLAGQDTIPPKPHDTLLDNYHAALLMSFLQAGLLEVLVELSKRPRLENTSSKEISFNTKATVLLGEILLLTTKFFPAAHCAKLQSLPTLVNSAATNYQNQQRSRAISVVTNLHVHARIKAAQGEFEAGVGLRRDPRLELIETVKSRMDFSMGEEQLLLRLEETEVIAHKDGKSWRWNDVIELLEGPLVNPAHTEAALKTPFFKRLIQFYKPKEKLFSRLPSEERNYIYQRAGQQMLRVLVKMQEGRDLMVEEKFIAQIVELLKLEVEACEEDAKGSSQEKGHHRSKSVGGPDKQKVDKESRFFDKANLLKTMSYAYFALLGTLSTCVEGVAMLKQHGVFQVLSTLTTVSNRDDLSAIIMRSLDYRWREARDILAKTMNSSSRPARFRATKFLLGLLRLKIEDFHNWGVSLLIQQLEDTDRHQRVAREALGVLDEACEDEQCLAKSIELVDEPQHLLAFGKFGRNIVLRFLSQESGLAKLDKNNFIENEMQHWFTVQNCAYIQSLEAKLWKDLSSNEWKEVRETDSTTMERDCLPPHLYGQLAKTESGMERLRKSQHFDDFFQMATNPSVPSLQRRAAIMAMVQYNANK